MRALLRELKAILEHEANLHGPMVPISEDEVDPHPERAEDDSSTPSSDAASDPAPEPAPGADARDRTGAASVEPKGLGPTPADAAPEPAAAQGGASTEAGDGETGESDDAGLDADDLPAPDTAADAGDASDTSTPAPTDSSASDASMPNYDLFGNEVDPAEDPSLPPQERIEGLIPDDAPYKDLDTLDEVEQWVAQNPLVPIDEDRENPVFGVGDPDAGLLIIGEAPGRDEDKQGEPFVGRAGKLLDKILDAIEFTRDDVYIANILKSRPPRNRDPHDEEVEAHIPILYKQIALIQPEIILCVGKVAGNTMLDRRSSLKNLRGKEHDFYGIPLYVTYHPAALLRNSNWKRPTWEDVKLVRTRYDELTGAS
jgi:DNA polymerase